MKRVYLSNTNNKIAGVIVRKTFPGFMTIDLLMVSYKKTLILNYTKLGTTQQCLTK